MPLTGKITLLQLDGDVNVKQLQEAVKAAKKGCMEIYKVQQKALKEKYGG